MAKNNKTLSRLGLGLAIGGAIGALAGVMLAPKSGKENRRDAAKKLAQLKKKFDDMEVDKKVKDIFGTVSEQSRDMYLHVTKEVLEKLSDLKGKVSQVDTKKYEKLVDAVLKDFRKRSKQSAKVVDKLRKHLLADWKSLFVSKKTRK